MTDNDADPLNIGTNVKEEKIKSIPTTPTYVKREGGENRVDASADLFTSTESKKRMKIKSKTILNFKVGKEDLFAESIPESPKLHLQSTQLPRLISSKSQESLQETEDFSRFINKESMAHIENSSSILRESRLNLLQPVIDSVQTLISTFQHDLSSHVNARSEEMKATEQLIAQAQSMHLQGIDHFRNDLAISYILLKKKSKIHKIESDRLRRSIGRTSAFRDFLINLKESRSICPIIDADSFFQSLESQNTAALEKKVAALSRRSVKLIPSKAGSGDWYENSLHPLSSSGKVIERFMEKVNLLKYNDVCVIIDHLNEGKDEFDLYEQLLFDLAWQKIPFPFGINKVTKLPPVKELFPAVIAQTVLQTEFAFTPFGSLGSMNWPFKAAVDMMFEMLISTNPFSAARVFWNLIQEVAEEMKKIMVIEKGIKQEDVEIDFDGLFPILIICVFAFGQDEWMQMALWVMSFNEQVSSDPQLQFSMTYLEGLVTQIMAIDSTSLKKKAKQMRAQWADDQSDPLGLHPKKAEPNR